MCYKLWKRSVWSYDGSKTYIHIKYVDRGNTKFLFMWHQVRLVLVNLLVVLPSFARTTVWGIKPWWKSGGSEDSLPMQVHPPTHTHAHTNHIMSNKMEDDCSVCHPSKRSVSRGGSLCESQDDSTDRAPGGLLAADSSGRTGRPSCKACTGRRHTGPKMEEWLQGKLLWGL